MRRCSNGRLGWLLSLAFLSVVPLQQLLHSLEEVRWQARVISSDRTVFLHN